MTLDYIKNIIDGYLYKLQSINSYDVDLYKKEYSIALKQFTDSFDALSQLDPELIQVNMPDIIGDEDAIRFKQVLEANSSTRYSIDILPTGNYYHDKIMGEDIFTPDYIRWHDENNPKQNLVINYTDANEKEAIYILNNILLNSMLTLPIGNVFLSFMDINYTGMGGLFTENLVSRYYHNEVIDSQDKFRDRVRLLSEHISTTMKKYGNVVSYNNKNRNIIMPYEIVVLNCYPRRYDGFIDELLPLFEHGPKYGVFFIVMNNMDYSLRKEDQQSLLDIQNYHIVNLPETLGSTKGRISFTPICNNNQLLNVCWDYLNNGEPKVQETKEVHPTSKTKQSADLKGAEFPIGTILERHDMTFKLGQDEHIHSFIIGRSGTGKSVLLHDIILGAIQKLSPRDLQLYLLDCKEGGVEFNRYKDVKHIRALLVDNSDIQTIVEILRDLSSQMRERGKLFREAGVQNIDNYNDSRPEEKMSRVWVVIDECHVLFEQHKASERRARTEIIDIITKVATEGRNQGIHLIMATQTLANADIPTAILNNITDRYVLNCAPSDAEKMWSGCSRQNATLDVGDVIYHNTIGNSSDTQFHASFLSKEEAEMRIRLVVTKEADCVSNGQFYFNGSQVFYFDDEIKEAVSSIKNNNLKACVGRSVSLRQCPVTITLKQDNSENILLTGIDEQGQTTRTAIDALLSLIISNANNSLNYKFYVLDYKDEEDGQYRNVLDYLDKNGFISIIEKRQQGDFYKKMAEDIKNKISEPSILLLLGQQRFRELNFKIETEENTIINDGFGPMNFTSGPAVEFKTYKDALAYILDNGPHFHVHTILQIDKISKLLLEEYVSSKFVYQKFRHLIILKSDVKDISSLGLSDDIHPEFLNSEIERLRAIYYADGDDGWTLFSPFDFPNETFLSTIKK